ncbi:MAG: D-alanine--D-alanine ligase [Gemmatimonadetes bacterium]|nr:D-alanine--D-alanine ligase [Gemmatimonadota bacterium]
MTALRIAVLLGGTSAERDVSLVSGARIAAALRSRGHAVTCVDPATGPLAPADEAAILARAIATAPPSRESLLALARSAGGFDPVHLMGPAVRGADVAFLALHGGAGEDGRVQAVLDLLGIPFTGSPHVGSALAMDKDVTKILLRAAGVPTADWLMAPVTEAQVRDALGLPVVVKPSKQGSTVGLSVVKRWDALQGAIAEASLYDDEVMVERFIPGRELTVAVLGDEALPVGEIIPQHEIYDYECKYTAGMAREEFPAKLEEAQVATVQRLALAAFRALKLRGYARIDFRLGEDGVFHCLEANTLPGMTALSLVPQAAAAAGITFEALCERVALSARAQAVRA